MTIGHRFYSNGNIDIEGELTEDIDKIRLLDDGSLYCDDFNEDQAFGSNIKHRLYNNGTLSIEGELTEL